MNGIDTAWPPVQRQYFQGWFKRMEHRLCISKFNKVTGMKETWGHDTKPRPLCRVRYAWPTKEAANTTVFSVYSSVQVHLEQLQRCQKYLLQN